MKFLQKDNIELINKSGIYQIKNIENNKIYIGSAKNFRVRFNDHIRKLKRNEHPNRYLQNVFNLNCNILHFSIIETLPNVSELLEMEQKYIDIFYDNQIDCYNLCPNARSVLGRKHTMETRNKISKSNCGKIASLETRLLQSKSNFIYRSHLFFKPGKENPMFGKFGKLHHNYGTKHSQESIEKMRRAKVGKIYPAIKVAKINEYGEIAEIYNSANEAGNIDKICPGGIRSVCAGKRKTAGGFSWKYLK